MRRHLITLFTCAVLLSAFTSPTAATAATVPPTWQWQISGTVDTTVPAQIFDIDAFDATNALTNVLHESSRTVVCYLDMGSAENYRPDYKDFDQRALSQPNPEWPDEKWIHPLRIDSVGPTGLTIRQVLTRRIEMAHGKGCDAIEPDMIEVAYASGVKWSGTYTKPTPAIQATFNRWIAAKVHANGMKVALKGDRDQATELEPFFDLAIDEQSYQYGEQHMTDAFLKAGKPVLIAEYQTLKPTWCADAKARGISLIGKHQSLGAYRTTC